MLAIFAQFERNIIKKRTKPGLVAAHKRVKKGRRPVIEEKIK
ncbi:hypothetical protein MHB40_20230 [Lysinibacillus sp. FSL K6-0057]